MRLLLIALVMIVAMGCTEMTRKEVIEAVKECEDAGLNTEVVKRAGHMGKAIVRVNCVTNDN